HPLPGRTAIRLSGRRRSTAGAFDCRRCVVAEELSALSHQFSVKTVPYELREWPPLLRRRSRRRRIWLLRIRRLLSRRQFFAFEQNLHVCAEPFVILVFHNFFDVNVA